MRWRYDTRADGDPVSFHGNPLITERMVITGSDLSAIPGGLVYAFERATGAVVWKRDIGGVRTDLLVHGGNAIGATSFGALVALDMATGAVAWELPASVPTDGPTLNPVNPALVGERIFYPRDDGLLFAVDAATGRSLWQHDLGARPTTPVRLIGDSLVVGTEDRQLLRLDPQDGTVLSRLATEDFPHHSLVAVGDCLIVLVGLRTLACVERGLTQVRWQRLSEKEWTTHAPLAFDGYLVAGTHQGDLFGLRLSDGGVVWRHDLGVVPRGLSFSGPMLYVGSLGGTLSALAP